MPSIRINPDPDALISLLTGNSGATGPAPDNRPPEPEPVQSELLTKPQAAALLNLSVRTMDRLVARGDIPNVRFSKRCVRFPIKPLRAWLESKTKYRK